MAGMKGIIGLDLGGNKVNVTAYDGDRFLIQDMYEIDSKVSEGPGVCLDQIAKAFHVGLEVTGWSKDDVAAVGLDTPGPASRDGVLNAKGATNFPHPGFRGFDLKSGVAEKVGLPVTYLNDGNAAALYAHWTRFKGPAYGATTSVSLIIGTGLGGGVVANGQVLVGKVGFAAELGHVTLPYDWNKVETILCRCNCGKFNDLESVASLTGIQLNLLPHMLAKNPDHPLAELEPKEAAKKVRGFAEQGDAMCRAIFEMQTWALAAHIDQMINIFDMDAVFIGGGGVQTTDDLQEWFLDSIRRNIPFREEQEGLLIELAADVDMAGARGAALYAAEAYL